MDDTFTTLETLIAARRGADPKQSYVARLTSAGRAKIAQKVGEEAVETVIAAVSDVRDDTIGEAADLIFHLSVLFADMDIAWADVMGELDRRAGVSGLTEKAERSA